MKDLKIKPHQNFEVSCSKGNNWHPVVDTPCD